MLKYDIQMFTEGEEGQVETPKDKETTTPFKAFESEEEFNKFTQSISSKAKGELLKEIGGSNVNEIKDYLTKGKQYDDVSSKITGIEEKYKAVLDENSVLKTDLIVTKYNVADEFKDEFITLAKAKITDDIGLEQAAQSVYEKLGKSFIKGDVKPKIQIGGDPKPPTDDPEKVMEKLRKI